MASYLLLSITIGNQMLLFENEEKGPRDLRSKPSPRSPQIRKPRLPLLSQRMLWTSAYVVCGTNDDRNTMGTEDSPTWPQGLMIHTKCQICSTLMDAPHCTNGGCPWCAKCGANAKIGGK